MCAGKDENVIASTEQEVGYVEESEITETESVETVVEEVVEENNDAEWDELLDDYEEYINNYIACMKKAQKGDLSAMTEMVELLEDAQSVTDKISNISGSLTSAQYARYTKLTQELVNSASNF